MKSSILSLAFISAVAFGAAPHDAVAKDASKKTITPNTAHCPETKSDHSQKPKWKSAYLVAALHDDTEQRMDENNVDEKLPIASITKLMTAYLVLQKIKDGKLEPHDRITVTRGSLCLVDSDFAVGPLPDNIQDISVEDALTHLILLSSNPMAENLAVEVAGSQEAFVAQMNAQAKEWGMNDTHFVNVHGLPVGDRKSEYTTANDLLKMAHHILPYMNDYKYYESRRLEVDRVALKTKPLKPWKKDFLNLGYMFKTATISNCLSLMTFAEKDNGIVVSIRLCGKDGNQAGLFAAVKDGLNNAFRKLVQIKSAEASTLKPEGS